MYKKAAGLRQSFTVYKGCQPEAIVSHICNIVLAVLCFPDAAASGNGPLMQTANQPPTALIWALHERNEDLLKGLSLPTICV